MFRKYLAFLLAMLLVISFVSCVSDKSKRINDNNSSNNTSSSKDEGNTTSVIIQGEPEPTFTVDWPSEMLPDDFPDLGKITKIFDSRSYSKKVTIIWNMVSEDQVKEIVDKLNTYLDNDHAWQGSFYSDGVKYQSGTEDEYIRVVIRYMPSASGEIDPDFDPQFFLEISGVGIPDKK